MGRFPFIYNIIYICIYYIYIYRYISILDKILYVIFIYIYISSLYLNRYIYIFIYFVFIDSEGYHVYSVYEYVILWLFKLKEKLYVLLS